jgi:hypothetical protein
MKQVYKAKVAWNGTFIVLYGGGEHIEAKDARQALALAQEILKREDREGAAAMLMVENVADGDDYAVIRIGKDQQE